MKAAFCKSCGAKIVSIPNRNRALRRGYGYCSRTCAAPRPENIHHLLTRNTSPEPNTGCFLWVGAVDAFGYGQISPKRRRSDPAHEIKAHRAAWVNLFGPIPQGLFICHKCDQRLCVNPAHLFVGTAEDNNRDARQKNRHAHRATHGMAKLSEEQVCEILHSHDTGASLAIRFGVSQAAISNIRTGKRWGRRREMLAEVPI